MSAFHITLKRIAQLGLVMTLGVTMNANAGWFGFGGTSWKEEVLLHDGSKIIVTRTQSYGGQHEVVQSAPISEHTITFTLPGSNKSLSYKSEYSEDVGRANFNLLALHVLSGTPYIVAEPNLCLAYNKWGRPNPPYVIFKYDGKAWQRIQLAEFPAEFKTINLIVNNGREEDIERAARKSGYVSVEGVREINRSLPQPEYKTILREAKKERYGNSLTDCEELVRYKGYWVMPNDPIAHGMVDRKTK